MKDPEDYHTRTLEGAAAHAAKFAEPVEVDWDGDYDDDEEDDEENYWDELEHCKCRDPYCPCDGP